jgi:hypothetical protein
MALSVHLGRKKSGVSPSLPANHFDDNRCHQNDTSYFAERLRPRSKQKPVANGAT